MGAAESAANRALSTMTFLQRKSCATSARARRRTRLIGSGGVKVTKYDIWTMDAKGDSRRVAQVPTLPEVLPELTPERRDGYVYVFKWTQSTPSTLGSAQGRYIWGCIAGRPHTTDLRSDVRRCLRN